MKEEFLHFIWNNGLFNQETFVTTRGEQIKVLNPGDYNRDSGPDFFNSRILIGDTIWAGNVEIHIKSSSWVAHSHHLDPSYNNVILHVVHEFNSESFNSAGTRIETAVMNWDNSLYEKYEQYLNEPSAIACRNDLNRVDFFRIRHWITRIATERLEEKSARIKPVLAELNNDWEETLYRLISRYYGMNVNSEPFSLLASRLPLRIIRRHSDDILQVEALLYGQAGLLEDGLFREALTDEYYSLLVREYRSLAVKYSLVPVDGWLWKFHRMRPANFPTVRISQLAVLLTSEDHIFARIRESGSTGKIIEIFNTNATSYWDNHYKFGIASACHVKNAGPVLTSGLLINCVIPMIFLYGKVTSNQTYCDRAIDLAENIPPENNRITREWESAGIIPASAFESQGLIGLRERMCKIRACLNCQIGSKLISLGKESDPRARMFLEEPLI